MSKLKIKLVLKNGIINFVLQIFPVLSALVCVPMLVTAWGKEVFGIYSLVSTIIILYSYLNFGIGPGVCKKVADSTARNDFREANRMITLGMVTMIVLGLLWSFLFLLVSRYMVYHVLNLQPENVELALRAFRRVFIISPVIFLVILLRSVFEAYQMFYLSGSVRAFLNSTLFLAPLPFLNSGHSIEKSLTLLALCYVLAVVLYLWILIRRKKFRLVAFRKSHLGELYRLSFWLGVTALFAAALFYIDRYLIAGLLGMTMVTFYVIAYDIITRVSLVSGSMTQSFFPAAAYWNTLNDQASLVKAYKILSTVLLIVMLFVCGSALLFAEDFLGFWVGPEFSEKSSLTFKILCLGVFFNSMAAVPLRFLGSTGFEKTAPILYSLLLIPHIALNVLFIPIVGIEAAALVFTLRALTEFLFLSRSLLKKNMRIHISLPRLGGGFFLLISFFALAAILSGLRFGLEKIGVYILIMVVPFGVVLMTYWKRVGMELEHMGEAGHQS